MKYSIYLKFFFHLTGNCDWQDGFLECGDGSCYKLSELCDGKTHCLDGSDEVGCKLHSISLILSLFTFIFINLK